MKIVPKEEYFVSAGLLPGFNCSEDKQGGTSTERAAGSSTEMGTYSTNRSWEQDDTAREQGTTTMPEISADPIPRKRGKGWESEERDESRNSPLDFPAFHLAGTGTLKKKGYSFAGVILGGRALPEGLGNTPSVVLEQLFALLCCQTDQETALKKQYPPHCCFFLPGSVPKHDSPHLCRGATRERAFEW